MHVVVLHVGNWLPSMACLQTRHAPCCSAERWMGLCAAAPHPVCELPACMGGAGCLPGANMAPLRPGIMVRVPCCSTAAHSTSATVAAHRSIHHAISILSAAAGLGAPRVPVISPALLRAGGSHRRLRPGRLCDCSPGGCRCGLAEHRLLGLHHLHGDCCADLRVWQEVHRPVRPRSRLLCGLWGLGLPCRLQNPKHSGACVPMHLSLGSRIQSWLVRGCRGPCIEHASSLATC